MKRIYLVRHGQTNANVNYTVQGPDELLSDEGEHQAARLAERVQDIDFEKIIASDYKRTQQTAEPIVALKKVPLELSSLFREEVWPTSWLGQTENTPERVQFDIDLIENSNDATWHFEDAENTTDIYNRIVAGLELLQNDPAETILVVSHGSFLKQLVGHVLLDEKGTKKEIAAFKRTMKTTNTGISTIVFENNRWRVLSWNDHAHFAE